jgi:uncharacterized protein (TIGR02271 family)
MAYEPSAAVTSGGTNRRTLTAFFDDRAEADRAMDRLIAEGISRDDIRLVPGSQGGTGRTAAAAEQPGLWEQLKDFFFPDEDRHTYAEGLSRGGCLVTVSASDAAYERALDILDDEGSVDMGQRETEWRSQGWTGYTGEDYRSALGTGLGRGATETGGSSGSAGEQVLPVTEEELRVGKRDVSHGRVKVRSYVIETPVNEDVALREERVNVERRPVDRPVSAEDQAFRERTIEVEQRAEEPVVAKEARVTEEVVVNKDAQERTETVSDTVRRTEVEVEDDRGSTTRGPNEPGRSGRSR